MRITRWVEYGVHILAFIAKQHEAGMASVGASRIAEDQGIARDYTLQVLHRLREGGLLTSTRGPHGGFSLSRSARDISLRDIMQAAEGATFEVICESKPLTAERCAPESLCGLRMVWYDLQDHINSYLETQSLEQLVDALYQPSENTDAGLVQLNAADGHESDFKQ